MSWIAVKNKNFSRNSNEVFISLLFFSASSVSFYKPVFTITSCYTGHLLTDFTRNFIYSVSASCNVTIVCLNNLKVVFQWNVFQTKFLMKFVHYFFCPWQTYLWNIWKLCHVQWVSLWHIHKNLNTYIHTLKTVFFGKKYKFGWHKQVDL